jgi:hypothetical protein
MSASSWVHLDVDEIEAETDKALLLRFEGQTLWVPKSQIADVVNYTVGDRNCCISVSQWFAEKEGLE